MQDKQAQQCQERLQKPYHTFLLLLRGLYGKEIYQQPPHVHNIKLLLQWWIPDIAQILSIYFLFVTLQDKPTP